MPSDLGSADDATPGNAHRALLALSFASDAAPALRDRLVQRARRALTLLCDGAVPRLSVDETATMVLEAGGEAPHHIAADGAFVRSFGVGGTDWRAARALDAPSLLGALRTSGAGALADYTPPFAVLFRTGPEAPLQAATDACGILHVFVTTGPGFAACGSSSLAVGALGDGGLDLESIAQFAQLGFYIGSRTPLVGVRRLRPGEACALADGGLRVAEWGAAPHYGPRLDGLVQAVDAGAQAIQAAVASVAAAHPRIGISLSGGLDSRMIVAALPVTRRAALDVACIETAGNEDADVVRQMAPLCGYTPTIVNLGDFPRPMALAFAEGASRRRDYCSNPLATAALEWAESQLPRSPRLHGQNGEFLRGFYYEGQGPGEHVTRERVDVFLAGGHFRRRPPAVLAADFREPLVDRMGDEIHGMMAATGRPWREALDEFYLGHHMAGWVGGELSRTSMRRVDLSPFLDPRMLAVARRAAPQDKFRSRLAAAIVEALDPALAAVPLEGRPPPAGLFGGDLPRRHRPAMPNRTQGPVGAAAVRDEMLVDLAAGRVSLARAMSQPLFDRDALAAALSGDPPIDVVTLGFALNVEWLLEFLEKARA